MLQNPVNQTLQYVCIGCTAAFPLAIDFDEHDIIGGNDSCRSGPRVTTVGAVQSKAGSCKKIKQGIYSRVVKSAIVNPAFLNHKDRRFVDTRRRRINPHPFAGKNQSPCCGQSPDEFATRQYCTAYHFVPSSGMSSILLE